MGSDSVKAFKRYYRTSVWKNSFGIILIQKISKERQQRLQCIHALPWVFQPSATNI